MTGIDDLLAQSLLLQDPQVPSDTVPYEDSAYPTWEDTPMWDGNSHDLANDTAAQHLRALCEATVAHCTVDELTDFITDQLPEPRGAWILGCVLQLADAEDGARFWWQYAAGAGDVAACYCLYLHHLARGDTYAAAFWQEQSRSSTQQDALTISTTTDDVPAHSVSVDTSLPTLLRILSRLASTTPREHTETADAVISFVTMSVTIGYDRNPDWEIPLPGPDFAEHLKMIIAATPASRQSARHGKSPAEHLPNRPALEGATCRLLRRRRAQEPEHVLVQVAAADEFDSAFFKEAIAACWQAATADRTVEKADGPGARLRYYLTRRPLPAHCRAASTRAA
ncbi:DUF6207 family protein [Streptomyces minutiscleroticus]|uniref:Uncharacterized protein n=1 Tax=Streptomyces minutiscleroticus TaxID=68238 RepID=A0A918P0R8_9ACTN|nr:DUF6207 family protein [Streptomyces minutiscleroticus]GGY12002.1 hypothetical protein GCM10010358_75520 [Streptomyces minutiscleroticus]